MVSEYGSLLHTGRLFFMANRLDFEQWKSELVEAASQSGAEDMIWHMAENTLRDDYWAHGLDPVDAFERIYFGDSAV
jgi:hypothetical protein